MMPTLSQANCAKITSHMVKRIEKRRDPGTDATSAIQCGAAGAYGSAAAQAAPRSYLSRSALSHPSGQSSCAPSEERPTNPATATMAASECGKAASSPSGTGLMGGRGAADRPVRTAAAPYGRELIGRFSQHYRQRCHRFACRSSGRSQGCGSRTPQGRSPPRIRTTPRGPLCPSPYRIDRCAGLTIIRWTERFHQKHPVLRIGLPAFLHTGECCSLFVAMPPHTVVLHLHCCWRR